MRHFASPAFWEAYERLPGQVRELADKNFTLLKSDPKYPSLHFKKIGRFWSARVGLRYRRWQPKLTATWFGSGSVRTPIMMP